MNYTQKSTEQIWLDAVEKVFDNAKKQKDQSVSRSEIESLIIGLRSVAESEKGKKVLEMLNNYLEIMKKKKKRFLKVA